MDILFQASTSQIKEFCRRHHIRRMALFGSVVRDDFGPDSDIDILVEFDPEHIPGYEFFSMQDELSQMFGCKVDLLTPGFLSPDIRKMVHLEEVTIYEQA